ncbi:Peptidase family C25 [Neorhodopirellula lusitana]|uniref:Peptidase family C25 n=1 Tax=Neorhodopirellula lusitana TaxID=445327 RepID=A0ABY1QNB2_9BACT|nr:C25 family cysteine peptidase [Neorhodopirellula lusitana]SMP74663.1 Peptidase family C25 [Neorhodopirellula lusitana]
MNKRDQRWSPGFRPLPDAAVQHQCWRPRACRDASAIGGRVGFCVFAFWIAWFAISNASVANESDVVVVCHDSLRDELQPWVQLRTGQGLSVAFCSNAGTARQTAAGIRDVAGPSTRYVVLVGDAPAVGTRTAVSSQDPSRMAMDELRIPTFYLASRVTEKYGSTPTFPSDAPYGDLDSDGRSDAAVGRIPVLNSTQLSAMVDRLIAYEVSTDFGRWRQNLQLTAGVGGFGAVVDGAIETVTRTVLTSALPPDAKPQIAYASPGHLFCPVGEPFADCVLRRYRSGARFWIYAGHGSVDRLDLLERSGGDSAGLNGKGSDWQVRSLLNNQSVSQLDAVPSRASIAVLLACYTGAFDAASGSLAEQMLLTPGGPIAVLAASRLTMPYGNARFGLSLLESVYQPMPNSTVGLPNVNPRLGDAILRTHQHLQSGQAGSTTQTIVDGVATLISPAGSDLGDERVEHAALYQLMGDPTLRLFQPVALEMTPHVQKLVDGVAGNPDATRQIDVEIASPIAGTARVWIDRPLNQVSHAQVSLASDKQRAGELTTDHDPHGCTLTEVMMPIQSDEVATASLQLPADFNGSVVVRAFVQGRDQWATAAKRQLIHRSLAK